jgi:integrase
VNDILACVKSEDDLIFPNEAGKPLDPSNLRKRIFEPALRRAGLRKVRFHDLRHTYASLLIHQGEHPKYIQSQMGHSSISVTMDVYGHLMEGINVLATERLDATLFGESSSKMVASK